MTASVSLIAAVAQNGVIGRDNDMPWKLSSDLKRFKALTMGKPIVMGRKTFQSIGKALPGRLNVVITRDPDFKAEGATVVSSLDEAVQVAGDQAGADGETEIMVIGGGEIYAQAMPMATTLYITEVQAEPIGDARFPGIHDTVWQEISRERVERDPRDSAATIMVVYRRRAA